MPWMAIEGAPSRINPDLRQLADQAAGGDDEAFEEIHRRLADGVLRYLRLLGGTKHAEDLVQVVWASFHKRLRNRGFDSERCVEAYIRGICRRELAYARRTEGRYKNRLLEYWRRIRHGGRSMESVAGAEEEVITLLMECLRAEGTTWALSDVERRVLDERLLREGTLRSVEKSVGVSASTVDSRVKKALGKLRRCLESKGYF